jgi:hypothetical protein
MSTATLYAAIDDSPGYISSPNLIGAVGSGKNPRIVIGYAGGNKFRGAIKFDPIPTDATSITTAILHMRSHHVFRFDSPDLYAARATAAWVEGTYGGDQAWYSANQTRWPNPAFTTSNQSSFTPGTAHDAWTTVDITGIYRDILASKNDFGIVLHDHSGEIDRNELWEIYSIQGGSSAYVELTYNTTPAPPDPGDPTYPDTIAQYFYNNWSRQCDPAASGYWAGYHPVNNIDDKTIAPLADCNASLIEARVLKEIMPVDTILPLGLQRIDNNNPQIKYYSTFSSGDTRTSSNGFRKFEPGGTFSEFSASWSGASSSYNKFFSDDCATCYPVAFNFGVLDQLNSMVYSTTSASSASVPTDFPRKVGLGTSYLMMKGAANAYVSYANTWYATTDPFSWGSSYSWTDKASAYAEVLFRGQSFKWYATVPKGKGGGVATIYLTDISRLKAGMGDTTYVIDTVTLPDNVNAEAIWEITFESGLLQPDTDYKIRIERISGFISIDSFEGYWEGSMVDYNEDSRRITFNSKSSFTQVYDSTYSNGSVYKWNDGNEYMTFDFTGDRVIVLGAKGPNFGVINISLYRMDYTFSTTDLVAFASIPGSPGAYDKLTSITVDTDTSATGGEEFARWVLFDSEDYPLWYTGAVYPSSPVYTIPWGKYRLVLTIDATNSTYSAYTDDLNKANFYSRCHNCDTPAGSPTTTYKYIYLDGILAHESIALALGFENQSHYDILTSVATALQVESTVTDMGLKFMPRIGKDTDILLTEGQNTLVNYNIVNDFNNMATILVSAGGSIDGLPLYTLTQDKANKELLKRTVMRSQDFRDTQDYMQLIGLSRTELKKRNIPERRVTVTHAGDLDLEPGDSFLLSTKKMGRIRVRINKMDISEDTSGTTMSLDCVHWGMFRALNQAPSATGGYTPAGDTPPVDLPGPFEDVPIIPPNPPEGKGYNPPVFYPKDPIVMPPIPPGNPPDTYRDGYYTIDDFNRDDADTWGLASCGVEWYNVGGVGHISANRGTLVTTSGMIESGYEMYLPVRAIPENLNMTMLVNFSALPVTIDDFDFRLGIYTQDGTEAISYGMTVTETELGMELGLAAGWVSNSHEDGASEEYKGTYFPDTWYMIELNISDSGGGAPYTKTMSARVWNYYSSPRPAYQIVMPMRGDLPVLNYPYIYLTNMTGIASTVTIDHIEIV